MLLTRALSNEKEIRWVGSSLEDLLAFPITVRKAVGYQLHKIQYGIEPDDWKPFSEIGAGVNEIRIRDNMVSIALCMSLSLKKHSTFCIVSKNRRNKPVSMIKTSPERVITGWCNNGETACDCQN